jgi:hypothetical protein
LSVFYSWLFKTLFVKFKINNNFKQNIDETHSNNLKSIGKSIPVMDFKNLKKKIREPKVWRLLPNGFNFQTENQTLGIDLKIYSLAYDFFILCDFHLRCLFIVGDAYDLWDRQELFHQVKARFTLNTLNYSKCNL